MRPQGSKHTTGIVLVGTHPWTNTTFDKLPPRPLLPVAHRPLISYALSWLRDGGIQSATVCANRETQVLESKLHRHVPHGLKVSYQEDAMPRGAAGAVRDAATTSGSDIFVVADGTAIPNVDIPDLLAAHDAWGADVTVVCHCEVSRNGKPAMHVPSGIYVFNRQTLENVPERGFCDIKERLIPELHRSRGRVCAYAADTPSPRVMDGPSYRAVNEWIVERLVATRAVPEGYLLSGGCLVHRDAEIARDATLIGPVLIGPGARIASGAVIVGPTSVGRDAEIGSGVLLSRSAVWRRCIIRDSAQIDRCILADDTVVTQGINVFREVMMSPMRTRAAAGPEPSPEPRVAGSVERWRKVRRGVLASDAWSRSPAAQ
jgi:NDP-sugar pyrophosphorylase family protein